MIADFSKVLDDRRFLLYELGLSEADVREIEHKEYYSLKNVVQEGLLLWKQRNGHAASYNVLASALKKHKHIQAAGREGTSSIRYLLFFA